MRAADLVRRIWRDAPPATVATTATPTPAEPCVSQMSQPTAPGKLGGKIAPVANVATVAGISEPANDPAPDRPQQPRPAVLRQPQHPGNAAEEALALLDQLHAWGVILTAEHGALTAHGLHAMPEPLREEVSILLLPDVQGRDLLAAVQTRDAATAAIERAMPLRVSKAGPCADYRQEGDHGH